MLGSLGFTEIAFILVLALLLFGPKRLPEIGRTLGKGMAEFRRASNELRRTIESEVALDESSTRRPAAVPALTSPEPRGVPAASPNVDAAVAPADAVAAASAGVEAAAAPLPEAPAPDATAAEPPASDRTPEGAV